MSFANKLKKIENDLIDIQNQGEIADKTKFFKDNIANFDKRNASLQKLIDHKNAIKIKNINASTNVADKPTKVIFALIKCFNLLIKKAT